jgi:hypothetical protein
VPRIFAVAYTYELPLGKGKRFLNGNAIVSQIAGGWQLTGIQQYQNGTPVQLTVNNTLSPSNPLGGPWFNKAAFSLPANYQYGDVPRSYTQLRAPNSYNENFGLMRRIRIYERVTLTVRAEFFNRVVFGAPASNVSASNFGFVSSQANSPRQGLMSARFEF